MSSPIIFVNLGKNVKNTDEYINENFLPDEALSFKQRAYIKYNISTKVKNILYKRAYIKYNISVFGGDDHE